MSGIKIAWFPILLAALLAAAGCRRPRTADVENLELRDGLIFEQISEVPFTGTFFKYRFGGQKVLTAEVVAGKLHGRRITWHPNGQKREESTWWIGERTGRRCWNREGQPIDCPGP